MLSKENVFMAWTVSKRWEVATVMSLFSFFLFLDSHFEASTFAFARTILICFGAMSHQEHQIISQS